VIAYPSLTLQSMGWSRLVPPFARWIHPGVERTKAIMKIVGWGLDVLLDNGLTRTCQWIKDQHVRKVGEYVSVGGRP
jgi:hypothetical protein